MVKLPRALLYTQKVVSSKKRDRYKRKLYAILRSIRYNPSVRSYVYISSDYATEERGATRKIAPSSDGSFLVRELRDINDVIQRGDTLECVSLDLISPVPTPASQSSAPAVLDDPLQHGADLRRKPAILGRSFGRWDALPLISITMSPQKASGITAFVCWTVPWCGNQLTASLIISP